jgi:hypothetical protein
MILGPFQSKAVQRKRIGAEEYQSSPIPVVLFAWWLWQVRHFQLPVHPFLLPRGSLPLPSQILKKGRIFRFQSGFQA